MIYSGILIASATLLLTFVIEQICRATRFPAVAALILAGVAGKPILASMGIGLVGLDDVVPVIGTLGLVLIVLDGALDIELNRERLHAVAGALVSAVVGFLACLALLAPLVAATLDYGWYQACIAAMPFAVISSAVAIPSSQWLPRQARDFVVYESSFSDIVGIIAFFALIGSNGTLGDFARQLAGGGALSLLLSLVCALALAYALLAMAGHIRYLPILAALFALYAIGKLFHLSPLLMVLMFGLAINNPAWLARMPLRNRFVADEHAATIASFKILATELTFAVRGFFFILLGYWTDVSVLADHAAWLYASAILATIYASRFVLLRAFRVETRDLLLWVAPRGLITVLLFIIAREKIPLPEALTGAALIVVIVSALLVLRSRPGDSQ